MSGAQAANAGYPFQRVAGATATIERGCARKLRLDTEAAGRPARHIPEHKDAAAQGIQPALVHT